MFTKEPNSTPVKSGGTESSGHPNKGRKRTRASIIKQMRTRRRNAREAAKAGKPYGRGGRVKLNRRRKSAPRIPQRTALGGARRAGAGEASAYLREASRRALALAADGSLAAAKILGLVELAREALGAE